ncbi:unnamed protein product [Hydatigera taeniaeformis]|uniref:BRCT domain-containing protein n=1 Tax=Hydatigena taeniaeformis TaxID=6205 RepID=A0A0R3WPX4_HYDTA|nr:unnamed protein product [Hydatigera taeniaeformis]
MDGAQATITSPEQSTSKVSTATDAVNELQSSSILRDVARRLESLGSNVQPFNEDPVHYDTPSVARRLHRTRRRRLPSCDSGIDGLGIYSSKAPPSDVVRWQYEDSPEVRNGLPSPHVAKSQSSRESTQPGDSGSPEKITPKPQQHPQLTASTSRARIFSISGVDQDEKMRYQAIITNLGADLDPGTTIGVNTTHLIINSPSRCEKYLMCMAGGRWILHKSYLDVCAAASTWLPEEAYEWGGAGTEPLLIQLSPATNRSGSAGGLSCDQLRDLAKAARHWRKTGGGAFKGWRVVFGPGCDRERSFRRIIEFGGGKVNFQLTAFSIINACKIRALTFSHTLFLEVFLYSVTFSTFVVSSVYFSLNCCRLIYSGPMLSLMEVCEVSPYSAQKLVGNL